MRSGRSILVLAVVTAVAVGAVLSIDREPGTVAGSGELVFPALLDRVNDVARVRVTGNEGTFTLARDGEAWVVEEKERYPAEPDRMHNLILGAAGSGGSSRRRAIPSTTRSSGSKIPPARTRSRPASCSKTHRGAELARWVLGNRRPSKSDPGRTELYIRTGDDPQAWLVEGSLPGGRAIIDWVDRLVARIDRERLRAVEVVHADGMTVAVDKRHPADADFILRGVPEGREIDAQYRINDIGRLLEDLRFEDVVPASALDFSGSVDKRVRVTTFDGLRIRMETVVRGGEAFARLRAEADETLVEAAGKASGTADGPLHTLEEVRAEAGTLNARWTGWAYELPSFKRDYIVRRVDELIRPLEDMGGEQEASGN